MNLLILLSIIFLTIIVLYGTCTDKQDLLYAQAKPAKPTVKQSADSKPRVYGNPNPNPKKPVKLNIGGTINSPTLLQYTQGGLQISPNGRNIYASIKPNTKDGSGNNKDRQRNEIAIKDQFKNGKSNISFNLNLASKTNDTNNRIINAFQIKPQGTNSGAAYVQVGVKNGKVAYTVNGKNSIPTNLPANTNTKVDIKMNNGQGTLYLNDKKITSFNVYSNNANVKFGLEGSGKKHVKDTVSATYNDITIT